MNNTTQTPLTALEISVLTALFESARGNGHDFGVIEAARSAVASPRQLSGVAASLVKKGVIHVCDKVNGYTQFIWVESNDDRAAAVERVELLIAAV